MLLNFDIPLDFFRYVQRKFATMPIIAESIGGVTPRPVLAALDDMLPWLSLLDCANH